MPNANFNSFLANYRSSIACKKIHFCIPKTVLNYFVLKTLLADGYIRSFKPVKNKFWITCIELSTSVKFNRIVKYSTQKRTIFVSFKELLILTKVGGYFILSTSLGIMNDSDARFHRLGGTLLLGIF
jgi:ribosomal protein S8